jgi:predicted PhzF superfamily epimerase YddE/YHI9
VSANQRFTQVDAFADQPFTGNPAAVCVLAGAREASWMQQVAQEMNLAETAFLLRRGGDFDLRWFTPTVEVDLCGHATLASAHVLWEEGWLKPEAIAHFHTRSGELSAARLGGFVGRTPFDFLVELESEHAVRSLAPDMTLLARLGARGVIVTAAAESGSHDFISRFFAPGAGVPEDPVTGSAHCGLGPFWSARLGKRELTGYQASARGGTVRVRLEGSRAHLGGAAVTVLRGELLH